MQEDPIKPRDAVLVLAAIGLVVFLGVPLLKGEAPSISATSWKWSPGEWFAEYDARSYCEKAVKLALKAPSTASFGSVRVRRINDAFFVEGTVDAKNGFGAEIRNEFMCDMDKMGDGWKLRRVCLAERC